MSTSFHPSIKLAATSTARALRKVQTPAEAILWNAVRDRRLDGIKFLRQHPFLIERNGKTSFFIADFYCAAARLVVEIDGMIHSRQKEADTLREQVLGERGLRIMRFSNSEVENRLELVLSLIKRSIAQTPREPEQESL